MPRKLVLSLLLGLLPFSLVAQDEAESTSVASFMDATFYYATGDSGFEPSTLFRFIRGKDSKSVIVEQYNLAKNSKGELLWVKKGHRARVRSGKPEEVSVDIFVKLFKPAARTVVDGVPVFVHPSHPGRKDLILESLNVETMAFELDKTLGKFTPPVLGLRDSKKFPLSRADLDQRLEVKKQIRKKLIERFNTLSNRGLLGSKTRAASKPEVALRNLMAELRQWPETEASDVITILTTYGEFNGKLDPAAHMAIVIQSLLNRANDSRFYQADIRPELRVRDPKMWMMGLPGRVALASAAYNVWDNDDPNLPKMLEVLIAESDRQELQTVIEFYAAFEAGLISLASGYERMNHYYSPSSASKVPDWVGNSSSVDLKTLKATRFDREPPEESLPDDRFVRAYVK